MKSEDIVYRKILQDVKRYISENRLPNKIRYVDDSGVETETVFQIPPTREEIEGLLIFLNKDKLAQA